MVGVQNLSLINNFQRKTLIIPLILPFLDASTRGIYHKWRPRCSITRSKYRHLDTKSASRSRFWRPRARLSATIWVPKHKKKRPGRESPVAVHFHYRIISFVVYAISIYLSDVARTSSAAARKASATFGSKWVPASLRIISMASSKE